MLRSSRSSGDTPIQFHAASLMDDAGCAQRVNPLELGILASPCKCRPDAPRPHAGKPATVKGYWSYYLNWIKPSFEQHNLMLHDIRLD